MTRFEILAADYLDARRTAGFTLASQARVLHGFVHYLTAIEASSITIENALAFATQPAPATPIWWSHRLSVVRGFAAWVRLFEPGTQVPPPGLLPSPNSRRQPHIYTAEDIANLVDGARTLRPVLRAATHETLIGLLAVTGMRIGEALSLNIADLDLVERIVHVRHGKFDKQRVIPLHPTTVAKLSDYIRQRNDRWPTHDEAPLFVSNSGNRLSYTSAHDVFACLVDHAGIVTATGRRARLHDFRHRFAVETLLGWYRSGDDVAAQLPILSTFLGHVKPSNTYWYLTATPELFGLVVDRLQQRGPRS